MKKGNGKGMSDYTWENAQKMEDEHTQGLHLVLHVGACPQCVPEPMPLDAFHKMMRDNPSDWAGANVTDGKWKGKQV